MSERSPYNEKVAMAADEDETMSGLLSILNRDEYDPQMLNQALALLKKAKLGSTTTVSALPIVSVAEKSAGDSAANGDASTATSENVATIVSACEGEELAIASSEIRQLCESSYADILDANHCGAAAVNSSAVSKSLVPADSQSETATWVDVEALSEVCSSIVVDSLATVKSAELTIGGEQFRNSWSDVNGIHPTHGVDIKAVDGDEDDDFIDDDQGSQVAICEPPSSSSSSMITVGHAESFASVMPSSVTESALEINRIPRVVLHRISPGNYWLNSRPCPKSKKFRLYKVNHRSKVESSSPSKGDRGSANSSPSSKEKSSEDRCLRDRRDMLRKNVQRKTKTTKLRLGASNKVKEAVISVRRPDAEAVRCATVTERTVETSASVDRVTNIVEENVAESGTEGTVEDKAAVSVEERVPKISAQSFPSSSLSRERSNSSAGVRGGKSNDRRPNRRLSAGDNPRNSDSVLGPIDPQQELQQPRTNPDDSEFALVAVTGNATEEEKQMPAVASTLSETNLSELSARVRTPCDDVAVEALHDTSALTNNEPPINTFDATGIQSARDKTLVASVSVETRKKSAKHKKKKHHGHHHHSRHGKVEESDREAALRRAKKKSSHDIDKLHNSSKRDNFINGFSPRMTSSSASKTNSTNLLDKMQDERLRLCKCVVRIERLHPAVAKRLARYHYVRTRSRPRVDAPTEAPPPPLSSSSSSSPPSPSPQPPQPQPKQSVVDFDTQERRRERKCELLRRKEKERELISRRHSYWKLSKSERRSPTDEPSAIKVKRRRVIRQTDSSDDEDVEQFCKEPPLEIPAVVVSAKIPSPLVVLAPPPTTTDNSGLTADVYGSFDVDVVKDALQVDDFLMSGNSGLDVQVASFAGDDDVLLKARQVGQPAADVAAFDDDDWPVDTPLSSWDSSKHFAGYAKNNGCAEAEDNLNEYEMYLDDCDLLGEMSPGKDAFEKISDPIPDDLFSRVNQSRKQGTEELQVQINGAINPSFLNHSPVKLSPHNVMLSSYVCDVSTTKEDASLVATTSNVIELPTALCQSGDSQKSNMAAAPFAMTTDLDVTANAVAIAAVVAPHESEANPPSPASVQVQANSDHSCHAVVLDESVSQEQLLQVSSRFQQPTYASRSRSSTEGVVWRFGQPPPDRVHQCYETISAGATTKKPKERESSTDGGDLLNGIKQRTQLTRNSLADRIAKELGTDDSSGNVVNDNHNDDDVISLMAPSSCQDSMFSRHSRSKSGAQDRQRPTRKLEIAQNNAWVVSSAVAKSPEQLEGLSNAELERIFEHDVSCGFYVAAMNVFNVLKSHADVSLKYTMLTSLLRVTKESDFALQSAFVGQLFSSVVELAQSFVHLEIHRQIRILISMFSVIKKCRRPTTSVAPKALHNFTRMGGPKYGSDLIKPPLNISEVFNDVLRVAIDANVAELPFFYREAVDAAIDFDEFNLRSLLIMFCSSKLDDLAKDVYKLGCCMGVYPRIKGRPPWIRLKSYYADSEIEVILRCFIVRLAKRFRKDSGSRSGIKTSTLMVFISIDELGLGVVTPTPTSATTMNTTKLLKTINCSLPAAVSRLSSVLFNDTLLNNTLSNEVLQRDKGRLVIIGPKATSYLMTKALFQVQQPRDIDYSDISSEEDRISTSPQT